MEMVSGNEFLKPLKTKAFAQKRSSKSLPAMPAGSTRFLQKNGGYETLPMFLDLRTILKRTMA